MKTSRIILAALIFAAACEPLDSEGVYYSESSTLSLAEVAEILSALPLENEHLMEVYNAVGASSGNGYDEEYMMSDLFNSPGSGVGDDLTSKSSESTVTYSRPLRDLFREYFATKASTKAGAADVEAYVNSLSSSDIQIYWPCSEDWDGETFPIITYDHGFGAETNMGYVLAFTEGGAKVVDSLVVDEEIAMQRPVWVINRNDDSAFTPLDMFLGSRSIGIPTEVPYVTPDYPNGPGDVVSKELIIPVSSYGTSDEGDGSTVKRGKTLYMKSFCMLRNYDTWFGGASEFFVKCGAVDGFWAETDDDMRLYSPTVTDFMVVVKRSQKGKVLPFQAIILTDWTSQMENVAFLITEDDGGTVTSWNCSAVVKYNSRSYGFEISIPYRDRDDIVWRGQLSSSFFEQDEEVTGRFGDVIITFALE